MKKTILLSFTLTAGMLCAWGTPLTPEQALSRLEGSTNGALRISGNNKPTLLRTVNTPDNTPAIYLFSRNDNSIMFVGADDLAEPMLGYTDVTPSGEMPPQLEWWLSEYARQIGHTEAAIKRLPAGQADRQTDTPHAQPLASTIRPAVWNFVPTTWNQDSPYNNLCPTVNGTRCYTGCTATAAAQVMKYHNYPPKGNGTKTYTPNQGISGSGLYTSQLSLDLSNVTFDWDNMLGSYANNAGTAAQKTAVAQLMQAVGYVAEMNYGTNASGASSFTCMEGMQEYLGYNEAAIGLNRQNFSREAWENLIYENIKTVGPVLYSGFNLTSAGHAFVCDGYYNGYFHFNWGWGGNYDGFFKLTALTPAGEGIGGNGSGDYSFDQTAVLNLTKPDAPTIDIDIPAIASKGNLQGSLSGNTLTLTTDQNWGVIYNQSLQTIRTTLAIKIIPESGEPVFARWYYSYSDLPTGYGFGSADFTLPGNLSDGSYKIYLMAAEFDNGYPPYSEYTEVANTVGAINYVNLTVSGGAYSVENVPAPSFEISDFELLTPLYLFTDFKISYKVSNNSGVEILDGIQPCIYTKASGAPSSDGIFRATVSNPAAVGDGILYDLTPGEDQATTQTSGMTCYTATVPSGQVYIGLRSANTGEILAEKAVPLGNKPAAPSVTATSYAFNGTADNADANNLSFNVGLSCSSGYLANNIRIYFFPEKGGTSINHIASENIFLEAGKSTTATVNGAFKEGVEGTRYMTLPYILNDSGLSPLSDKRVYVTIGKAISAIDEIADETAADRTLVTYDRQSAAMAVKAPAAISAVEVYTIDGRRGAAEVTLDGDFASINLNAMPLGAVIIKVTLANGEVIVEKVMR